MFSFQQRRAAERQPSVLFGFVAGFLTSHLWGCGRSPDRATGTDRRSPQHATGDLWSIDRRGQETRAEQAVASSRGPDVQSLVVVFSVPPETRLLVRNSGSFATKSLANLIVSLTLSVPFTI